jgi:hypothetical protein
MDWPVALRHAAYDRVPTVRASGHGHPGRKHRCSLPMSELSPPGSACAYAFHYPQDRPPDSLNEILQSDQHSLPEAALILPPRRTSRGLAAGLVGSALGKTLSKTFGTICCNRDGAWGGRCHGAPSRSARRSRIWRTRRTRSRICRRAPPRQRQLHQGCVARARKTPQYQAQEHLPRLLKPSEHWAP